VNNGSAMISIDELELIDKAFEGFHIPSKPDVLIQIEQILKAQEPDMAALADLAASDLGVSSVVLKTINAPFYGMCRTISEIKQAVMLLGMEVIRALVVGVILRRAYSQQSCISLERFWDNTTDIANTMVYIGNRTKSQVPIEMLYTTGLFQNCAIPAFAIKYRNYAKVLDYIDTHEGINVVDLEDKCYSTNHAVMGYYIASAWGLPKKICNLILNHHNSRFLTSNADEGSKLIYATLKVAENVINRVRRFQNTTEWEKVGPCSMELLNIDQEEFEDIEDDIAEILNAV
jgi:HD-like signal output (HDOD) protein